MATRWFGAPVQRLEDPRLLRGRGNYVDDIDLPEMLHAAVLRSTHARARIVSIDASAAWSLPGVHLVLTAQDLGEVFGTIAAAGATWCPDAAAHAASLGARRSALRWRSGRAGSGG